MKLQVRLETFNADNHTNFQGVSTNITSTRRVQIGLNLNF